MGKPRRLSQKFLNEERAALAQKRHLIRQLHQRKPTDFSYKEELPDEIPLQLVVGSKVTARVRQPSDGLFTGRIEAVDVSDFTYRIAFDRPELGSLSIPDYEVSVSLNSLMVFKHFCLELEDSNQMNSFFLFSLMTQWIWCHYPVMPCIFLGKLLTSSLMQKTFQNPRFQLLEC